MTPEERAKRIVENIYDYELDDGAWAMRYVCNEIREAVAEIYEDAARIVADAPGNTYSSDCDHEQLAASIRARKEEVSK